MSTNNYKHLLKTQKVYQGTGLPFKCKNMIDYKRKCLNIGNVIGSLIDFSTMKCENMTSDYLMVPGKKIKIMLRILEDVSKKLQCKCRTQKVSTKRKEKNSIFQARKTKICIHQRMKIGY